MYAPYFDKVAEKEKKKRKKGKKMNAGKTLSESNLKT